MSFEDLHLLLKRFYATVAKRPTVSQKERVYLQAMRAYKSQYRQRGFLSRFTLKRLTTLGIFAGMLALFMIPRATQDVIVAGTVNPEFGPVEIIRNNESFLAKEETPLLVGDFVKVGRNARAKVSMPNKVVSFADDLTQFRITDVDAIYLLKGSMQNQILRKGEIATDRGFIKSRPGASFDVSVTDTGETRIALTKNEVEVFDLFKGSMALREGETLTLRSDTELSGDMMATTPQWDDQKDQFVRSKLIIARSKTLRALENQLSGKRSQALLDLKSAENSFISIVEVAETERKRELAKRKNLDGVSVKDVYPLLEASTRDQDLLREVAAGESLLSLTQRNWNNLAFGNPSSGVVAFDKMVLLYHLYSLAEDSDTHFRDLLSDKYARIFLQDIYTNRLKIDQISYLNGEIQKLPDHEYARSFLERIAMQADPYLQAVLNEKIKDFYGSI